MSAGAGALGAVNSALPLVGTAVGIVAKIFGQMALRSKQAKNENSALNNIVGGFDQALQQIQAAYNNGQITQGQALNEVNQIWAWYWKSITPQIQPNRNGCASGTRCPGTAIQYASTNGVPAGFCSSNEGASCCVGCGPIRLTLERVTAALEAGSGQVTVAPIGGDHYGLSTRASYQLTFSPFSTPTSAIGQQVDTLISQSMSGISNKDFNRVESALGLTITPQGKTQITSTFILIVLAFAGLVIAVRE